MEKKILLIVLLAILMVGGSIAADADDGITAKILLYHQIFPDDEVPTGNECAISTSEFAKQMLWLKENDYTAITISDLRNMVNGVTAADQNKKYVVITFDDGFLSVYEYAFPLLNSLGFPAVNYVLGEKINTQKNLTGDMLYEMLEVGWEIGSHSMSHSDLVNTENLGYEICQSRGIIANAIGHGYTAADISSFAYPYGSVDKRVIDKVYECGYSNGRGLGKGKIHTYDDLFYLNCETVLQSMTFDDFVKMFE